MQQAVAGYQERNLPWELLASQYEGTLHTLRAAADSAMACHDLFERIDEIRCRLLELYAQSVRRLSDVDALKFKARCEILEEEILPCSEVTTFV